MVYRAVLATQIAWHPIPRVSVGQGSARPVAKVLVATTAMLAFISYLARGRDRPERPRFVRLLRRRRSRAVHRQDRSLVHPRHDAALLRGFPGVCRELQHVRARRRVSRGEGGHGRRRWRSFPFPR